MAKQPQQAAAKTAPVTMERGLPTRPDIEGYVLGQVLMGDSVLCESLASELFSTEANRRILAAAKETARRGFNVDRASVANELIRLRLLESVGGLTYLTALDQGIPMKFDVTTYVKILREMAILRKLIFVSNAIQNSAFNQEPSEEIIGSFDRTMINLSAAVPAMSAGDVFDEAIAASGGLDSFLSPPKSELGTSTGYWKLDEYIEGIQREQVYIIGGATSSGKSALGVNIAVNLAKAGERVDYFSLEMRRKAVLRRMICGEAQVASDKLRRGLLDADERQRVRHAIEQVRRLPLYIDDTPRVTTQELMVRIRQAKAKKGIGAVFVDYVQQVDWRKGTDGQKHDLEYNGITDLCNGFQRLIRSEKIAGVLISQLHRQSFKKVEEARPRLSDFHGSSSLEKTGDIIMLLFNPSAAGSEAPEHKGVIEIGVAKQRDGRITPPRKWLQFHYEGRWTRFYEEKKE